MALSRKLLSEDEVVVFSLRTHPKALVGPLLMMVAVAAAAGLLTFVLPMGDAGPLITTIIWVLALGAIAWLTLGPLLRWLTTEYTVTDRRIVTRQGIITRTGHDVPLARISDVSYEHGLIDRVFGCGTIVIDDASQQGRVVLDDVPHVEQVQLRLSEMVSELHGHRPRGDDGA